MEESDFKKKGDLWFIFLRRYRYLHFLHKALQKIHSLISQNQTFQKYIFGEISVMNAWVKKINKKREKKKRIFFIFFFLFDKKKKKNCVGKKWMKKQYFFERIDILSTFGIILFFGLKNFYFKLVNFVFFFNCCELQEPIQHVCFHNQRGNSRIWWKHHPKWISYQCLEAIGFLLFLC